MTFDEFGFEDEIMDGLDAMNFREATPVQEKAIPVIMDGKDMIACAQTGTGKTAAFILPLMNRMLLSGTGSNKVRAIIVTPTRELAQQIDLQFEGFSYFAPISTVAVSGGGDGASWEQQKRLSLSSGPFASHFSSFLEMASWMPAMTSRTTKKTTALAVW